MFSLNIGDEPIPSDPLHTLQNLVQTLNERHQDDEDNDDDEDDDDDDDDDWQTVSGGESPSPSNEGDSVTFENNEGDSTENDDVSGNVEND